METSQRQACACAPLAGILPDGPEVIKGYDHICPATQALSRQRWIESMLLDQVRYGGPVRRSLPLDCDRWTEPVQMGDGAFPIPIARTTQEIVAVIRQRVEDPTGESDPQTERRMLGSASSVDLILREIDLQTAHLGDAVGANFINTALPEALASLGVPRTPEAGRYWYDRFILRKRTLLVTTFILRHIVDAAPNIRGAEAMFTFAGSSTWATREVLVRAAETAWQHGEWWRGFPSTYRVRLERWRRERRLPPVEAPIKNPERAVPTLVTAPSSDRRPYAAKESVNPLRADAELVAQGRMTPAQCYQREYGRRLKMVQDAAERNEETPPTVLNNDEERRCNWAVLAAISRARKRAGKKA